MKVHSDFSGRTVPVVGPASGIGRATVLACVAAGAGTLARTGRVDAAILSSAIQQRAPIEDIGDDQWQRHLNVNLSGVFYFLRALFPVMKRYRFGSILAFTSGLARGGGLCDQQGRHRRPGEVRSARTAALWRAHQRGFARPGGHARVPAIGQCQRIGDV